MAWAAPVAGVLGVIGALSQARSQRQAAEANAMQSYQNAQTVRAQAAAEEARQRRQFDLVLGRMRANYGASGVTPEGSPLDVLEMSVANAELDALATRYKGDLASTGYMNEYAQNKYQAKAATRTGYWRAATALVSPYAYRSIGSELGSTSTKAPVEDRYPLLTRTG